MEKRVKEKKPATGGEGRLVQAISLPPHLLRQFTEAVTKEVLQRLLSLAPAKTSRSSKTARAKLVNPLVADTSALIDGRILEVASSGFLTGTLLIPKFIILELQAIADSPEALRRGRGRRGLEILAGLKKIKDLKFKISDEDVEGKDVDEKLLKLAKNYKAKVITCDFNLNRVAHVFGLKVLNINDLAQKLRTVILPGEEITLKIVQEGKEKNQGVGYLPDGTMIVVEEGRPFLGQEVTVVVSRVLQTVAGRMIFAKAKGKP